MIISVNTGVVFAEGDINVVLEAENFVSSVVTNNGVTEGAAKAEDGVMKISTKADYAAFGMDFEVKVGGWYVMEWINTPENNTYSKTELALNGDKLISNEKSDDMNVKTYSKEVYLQAGDNNIAFYSYPNQSGEVVSFCDKISFTYNNVQSMENVVKDEVVKYLNHAREAYVTEEYSDYTSSVIDNYRTSDADYTDSSKTVTLNWSEISGEGTYTLTLAEDELFTKGVKEFKDITEASFGVDNLKPRTIYFYKASKNGTSTETYKFYTSDTPRFLTVTGGARNVRDAGGWNGIKSGMIFRGSEINFIEGHGYGIDDNGINLLKNELGVKTDLDLRGTGHGGLTESPLGSDVTWKLYPLSKYVDAYNEAQLPYFKDIFENFANKDNYPYYIHCKVGCDRTGTVAFLTQALCGVKEEDLSIDYELSSFKYTFHRLRYDYSTFYFASMVKILKEFKGETLKEKAENYATEFLGVSNANVSNVQSILSGNGVTFEKSTSLKGGEAGSISLKDYEGYAINRVTNNGRDIPFSVKDGKVYIDSADYGTISLYFTDGTILTDKVAKGVNDNADVYVNGDYLESDTAPVIINGRTLVPMRSIFEKLGAEIKWDDATKTVTGTKNGTEVIIKIGEETATANGESVRLDVPAIIENGRTLVPLRFVSEALGCQVGWEETEKRIDIISIPEGGTVVCDMSDLISEENIVETSDYGTITSKDGVLIVDVTKVPAKDQGVKVEIKKDLTGMFGPDEACVVVMRARLVSGGDADGDGYVKVQVQAGEEDNFGKAVFERTKLKGDGWQYCYIPFKSKANSISAGIRFGGCVQKVEIKDFKIINFGNNALLRLPSTVK